MVLPPGFEPGSSVPETDVLSIELRKHIFAKRENSVPLPGDRKERTKSDLCLQRVNCKALAHQPSYGELPNKPCEQSHPSVVFSSARRCALKHALPLGNPLLFVILTMTVPAS